MIMANLKLIGNTVDEEEAFLKLVSNIGVYKDITSILMGRL